jgi:hypothetical protein
LEQKAALAKARPQPADRPPHRIGSAGSPPYYPTEKHRTLVKALAGMKMTKREICQVVINPHTERPISHDTLDKYFRPELEAGWASLKSLVGRRYIKSLKDGQAWAIRIGLRQFYGWKSSGNVVVVPLEAAAEVATHDDDETIREFEHLLLSIRAARTR